MNQDGSQDSKIEEVKDSSYAVVLDSWPKISKMAIHPLY